MKEPIAPTVLAIYKNNRLLADKRATIVKTPINTDLLNHVTETRSTRGQRWRMARVNFEGSDLQGVARTLAAAFEEPHLPSL